MGRPLNEKYFGNRNTGGEGGESIASVTVGGTNNDYTAIPTYTVGAPDLPGGVQAVVSTTSMSLATVAVNAGGTGYAGGETLTITGGTGTSATLTVDSVTGDAVNTISIATDGAYTALPSTTAAAVTGTGGNDDATFDLTFLVDAVTVDTAGSGYQTAPTVTDAPDGNGTFTAVMTTGNENSVVMTAYLSGGSGNAADIVAQTGSNRYRVTTSDGTGEVTLAGVAAGSITAGQANITAVDSAGGTYFVTKITGRTCIVTAGTGTQFSTGDKVPWTFESPTLDVNIQIPNG